MTTDALPLPCALSPRDKKAQAKRVGDDLVKHHGKRRFYSVQQLRDANRRQDIALDFGCWSHAMFNSRPDFDRLHEHHGAGACDYASMKAEMLDAVSAHHDGSWFDFDLSWLEFPDIDWDIFDFFD